MARKSNTVKQQEIHSEALKQFDDIQTALREERMQCLQDRRFYSIAGAQWEGRFEAQFANKPKLEVNKIHLSIMRIISEYRNNRITVDFVSKDGSTDDKLADVCDGLYRADERDSGAEEAYDNGFEEAVGGGFGAWRLRACYEDEGDPENEKQRIRIEPIFDADSSVFFDLNAKRQDKADAQHCFVLHAMTPASYKATYDKDPASWSKEISQVEFDWFTPDMVYVAEYYRVFEENVTFTVYTSKIDGTEKRLDEEEVESESADLIARGYRKTRERVVKQKRVEKYIMDGMCILEDCGILAGRSIPVVPNYGKRWFIDNIERCMGHVRLAKDPQRLKNMQISKLAEVSALSSIRKPIFAPEQMAGHQIMWAEDNIKNFPYLLANLIKDLAGNVVASGPLAYTESPEIPAAMAALLQLTEQDMQEILGINQQGEQIASNISGKAVEMIQQRLDMQTFIYMSNMAKAVQRTGEIWLEMARDIYVEKGRKMKSIGTMGEVSSVELQAPMLDKYGQAVVSNDLTRASFDVAVEVGPSTDSRRQSLVRSLMGIMQVTQDPETLQILSAMAIMNMDGEGMGDLRDFYRKKLVTAGVVKPTPEEEKELQEAQAAADQAPPDANTQYLQAAAAKEQALTQKAQADTALTAAKTQQTQADTAKTIQEIEGAKQNQALDLIDRI